MTKYKVNKNIRLEVRKNTSKLQAVIKDPDSGKWRRVSAGTSDHDAAVDFAIEKLAEWRVLLKQGFPTQNERTFGTVAKAYIKRLQADIDAGESTESQKSYVGMANNWLIPFFDRTGINRIDAAKITEFDNWCRKKNSGDELAKGTISKHYIVLRAVFDFAIQQKWCTIANIPPLSVRQKGDEPERRGHFDPKEFSDLMRFMAQWTKDGKTFITKHKREVLRTYAGFLAATGARPGRETLTIRWSDFEHVQTDKDSANYWRLHLRHGKKSKGRGKKDQSKISHRYILVSEDMYYDLQSLTIMYNGEAGLNDLIFAMPDGTEIKGFPEMFRNCLTEAGMRYGKDGRKRSLYSFRHTYATWKLTRKDMSYEMLKRQMGTSVKMLEDHYDDAMVDSFAEEIIL